jgi:pimeloyl-ACP methyl ester carboxylesterase
MRISNISAILLCLTFLNFGANPAAMASKESKQEKPPLAGPNIPLPTLGGKQLWADTYIYAGWRIQQNVVTSHFRLLDDKDVRRAWGEEAACRAEFDRLRTELMITVPSRHAVFLLHGIGRSKETFEKMSEVLSEQGYTVVAVNYPSTRRPLEAHANQLAGLLEGLEDTDTVSFVTHSMGGIVLRAYFGGDNVWPENLKMGRTVMLGPPNKGSTLAALIKSFPFDLVYGESGEELAQTDLSQFPSPEMPFAVIAGGLSDGAGYNPLIDGDDDGVVTVSEAYLEGVAAFMVIDQLHSFLASDERAIAATLAFLQGGELAP